MKKIKHPIEMEQNDDGWLVTFPAFGYGVTDGDTYLQALENAVDALSELIANEKQGRDPVEKYVEGISRKQTGLPK